MKKTSNPVAAYSAADAHMKLLRSKAYWFLAATMLLAIPVELALLRLGSSVLLMELGFLPSAFAVLLLLSASVSLVMIPFALLAMLRRNTALTTGRALSFLAGFKRYIWYALIIVISAVWYWGITTLKGGTGPDLSSAVFFAGIPVLTLAVVYAVLLRNAAICMDDFFQAIKSNEFPHAFGHSSGIIWQSLLLACVSVVMALLSGVVGEYLQATLPVAAAAGYIDPAVASATVARIRQLTAPFVAFLGEPLILLAPLLRFLACALMYVKYMRVSDAMKDSGVDIIYGNTPVNASPIHTVDK